MAATMNEAPAVQYARTEDGYDIAYAVAGEGTPLILLPPSTSHVRVGWRTAANQPLLMPLAQRYRLARFDMRGQGMSTRGLPAGVSMEDYLRDLNAVVEHLGFQRFVLFGWYAFWRVGVLYAARHPERVAGLILYNADEPVEPRSGDHPFMALARDSWDLYLSTLPNRYAPSQGSSYPLDALKDAQTQDDFLKMLKAIMASDVTSCFSEVSAPTLIMAERFPQNQGTFIDSAQTLAAHIPNSRLVTFNEIGAAFAGEGPNPSPFILAVEDFVSSLPGMARAEPVAALSTRQREVLRLLAEGKTTHEIAEALVLSERTVERHIADVYAKISARNRAEATAYAVRNSLT
jgi:pimeloyl-ACP methyl ester carboxylesterase/DNA-binding CsgD family transcriptional regulator